MLQHFFAPNITHTGIFFIIHFCFGANNKDRGKFKEINKTKERKRATKRKQRRTGKFFYINKLFLLQ